MDRFRIRKSANAITINISHHQGVFNPFSRRVEAARGGERRISPVFFNQKRKNKHRRQRRNNSNQDYNLQWRLAIRAARRQDAYSREEDSWQRIRSHINIRIKKK
jgi:hypothetical protein